MQALMEVDVCCPYCGSVFTTLADLSAAPCDYIEDCAVCCQPIEFELHVDSRGEPQLNARRGDD